MSPRAIPGRGVRRRWLSRADVGGYTPSMAAALEPIAHTPGAAWYAVRDAAVPAFLVSTPESREVVNRPEIVGCAYTTLLRRALTAALETAPFRDEILSAAEHEVCVLHFLRGGLNFGIREALHDGLHLVRHGSAFLSSQRRRGMSGRWHVEEDQYRKIQVPERAVLLVGDVVATGATLEHGFRTIATQLRTVGGSIRRLIVFTIGCRQLETILAENDRRLRQSFPGYEGATAIYLEGRFTLVGDESPLRIAVPGTDLVRLDALLAPELVATQAEDPAFALERCAVYDAGSRAFEVPAYLDDVLGYWQRVAVLADEGLTLAEALAERRPDAPVPVEGADAAALARLCARRIETLSALAAERAVPTAR